MKEKSNEKLKEEKEDLKSKVEEEFSKDDSNDGQKKDLDNSLSSDESLKKENEDLKNKFVRLQADFINFKNRVEREKTNSILLANENLILKFLPVLDNFNRAFNHLNVEDEMVKGFVMIKEQFEKVLKDELLEEIKSDGEHFDPKLHNAIMTEEKEGVESGIILETFEKGYKIKEKVIRPSMVKVSK